MPFDYTDDAAMTQINHCYVPEVPESFLFFVNGVDLGVPKYCTQNLVIWHSCSAEDSKRG